MSSQPVPKKTVTQDSNVLPFRKSYHALGEAQAKRQSLHRLRLLTLEVSAVIGGSALLSLFAGVALARLIPIQVSQEQKLQEITTKNRQLNKQVEQLRAKLPLRFGTGEPDSTFLLQHGWLKPNQSVVRFLPQGQPEQP